MRNERLARAAHPLSTTRPPRSTIERGRRARQARGDLCAPPTGALAIEAFFAALHAPTELRGPPKVLSAPNGFSFSDVGGQGCVSLINLASGRATWRTWSARRSIRCASAGNLHVERLASLGRSSTCVGRRSRRRRRRRAQGDEAHRALRGHQCRSGNRRARHGNPRDADEDVRPRRLRHLRRGRHAGNDRGRRHAERIDIVARWELSRLSRRSAQALLADILRRAIATSATNKKWNGAHPRSLNLKLVNFAARGREI